MVHGPDSTTDEPAEGTDSTHGGRATHALRNGGSLVVGDDELVVDRDEEPIRFAVDDVVEVTLATFDYFLGILSVGVVGFGLLSLERNVVLALVFTAIGLASLYRTYRRRGALQFRVSGHAKPLVVYPEHPQTTYDALQPYVEA